MVSIVLGREFAKDGENQRPTGGRPRRECYLTLEAAKHIAMLAGTEKGFDVREYFIECERRAKRGLALPDFSNPAAAARAWAEQFERRERLELENKANQALSAMVNLPVANDIRGGGEVSAACQAVHGWNRRLPRRGT